MQRFWPGGGAFEEETNVLTPHISPIRPQCFRFACSIVSPRQFADQAQVGAGKECVGLVGFFKQACNCGVAGSAGSVEDMHQKDGPVLVRDDAGV